ncbi:MAG: anion permease [Pseudomonadota bacterium]
MSRTKLIKFAVSILVGILLWNFPMPIGVEPKAWHLFSIFVATITAIILKPFPMGTLALMGMLAATLTGVLTLEEGLSGFSKSIIWLVVFVFFIARGFVKTNLGTRVAYCFVRLLGSSTLGLGYGVIFTELVIAPFVPSNSARTGGIMLPIIKSISEALGSSPKNHTEKKLGSFLAQVSFHGNLITSAMFLTAMAANPLAQSLAMQQGVEITWINWFNAAIIPGLVSLIVIPFVLYIIYPPKVRYFPEAVDLAKNRLREMGPMSAKEWTMAGIFFIMLVLWMVGETADFEFIFGVKISAPTAALLGLCLLLAANVIDWRDVLLEHEAWHTLVWLAILVTMSTFLDKFGFIGWFSGSVGEIVKGWSWQMAFLTLILSYFYSHYFFASNTAHVSSMYAAFLMVSISVGTPPLLAALVLAFFSSLFSSMTHYGTSAGAVLYAAGYVTLPDWWKNGLIISVVNILIWLGIGGLWWKVLGIW